MNLPPIIKSGYEMNNTKDNHNKNNKNNNTQDMFGLGIQVFKIQSKKDVISSQSKNKNFVQRQTIKNIENPSNNVHVKAPPIPKTKKTSGILPSLNKTGTQPSKDQKGQRTPQTQNMVSKKKIERQLSVNNKVSLQNQKSVSKRVIQKKPMNINKSLDVQNVKKVERQKENESEQPQVIKMNNNKEMNSLINFYTCSKEFRANEAKKLKKRNTELYGEYAFIEGYCEKESKVYAQTQPYDNFSLDNYMQNQGGFSKSSYANYKYEEQ